MTDEELAEWGREEILVRKSELEAVDSAEALKRVQAAIVKRRRTVGLSRNNATRAVLIAQRLARGDSFSWATR